MGESAVSQYLCLRLSIPHRRLNGTTGDPVPGALLYPHMRLSLLIPFHAGGGRNEAWLCLLMAAAQLVPLVSQPWTLASI